MARTSSVIFGAINIVTHPHSVNGYSQLWHAATDAGRAVKVWGDSWGMIGTAFDVISGNPDKGITGEIYRFTNIDENAEWLDLQRKKPVSDDEIDDLINIPEHLRPNLRRIRYFFSPEKHTLIFASSYEGNNLSPDLAARLLEELIGHPSLTKLAPNLTITVEQSREKIDYILQKLQIEKILISIEVPNGDDEGEEEESVESVLLEQNARKQRVSLEAQKHKQLNLNTRNTKLAHLAASNGFVEATGFNLNGDKETVKTKDHPFKKKEIVPRQTSFVNWFVDRARDLIETALRK